MRNSYRTISEILFWAVVATVVSTFFMLVSFASKYFNNLSYIDGLKDSVIGKCMVLVDGISNSPLYSNAGQIFVFTALLILSLLFLRAAFIVIGRYIRTASWIRRHMIKDNGDYITLKIDEAVAFNFGFPVSKVYISQWYEKKAGRDCLDVILQHEKEHYKRSDFIKRLMISFLKELLPLSPLANFYDNFVSIQEISVDRAVSLYTGKKKIANAILKTFTHTNSLPSYAMSSVVGFSRDISRIEVLISDREHLGLYTYAVKIIVLLFAVLSLSFLGQNKVEAASQIEKEIQLMSVESSDVGRCLEQNSSPEGGFTKAFLK